MKYLNYLWLLGIPIGITVLILAVDHRISYLESKGYPQKRSVEVIQVGKGYTVVCKEDRNPYPYLEAVATTVEDATATVGKCLTMRIRPDWRE